MIPFFLSLILGAQSALAQDEIQPVENSVVKKLVEENGELKTKSLDDD